jgi:hypothetical protein
MYPRDTIDVYGDVDVSGDTRIIATSTKTLLHLNIVSDSGTPVGVIKCGTTEIYDQKGQVGIPVPEDYNYVCNSAVYVNKSASGGHFSVYAKYVPRDRTVTPDPYEQYATSTPVTLPTSTLNVTLGTSTLNTYVTNFPTSFNVSNFPSLQNVNCTIGCDSSSTLILSSSTVNVLTTSAPTFNEWLFICGVFLAINSIHLWNFIFKKPQKVK